MPAVVAWHLHAGWLMTASIFACFAFWAVPGWGKYFSAFHGRDNLNEHEIEWIDNMGYYFYPIGTDNYARGRFCMALRGMYLYFLFIVLAFIKPITPLIGSGMLLQGWCYGIGRYFPEKYGALIGEALTALLICLLIRMCHG